MCVRAVALCGVDVGGADFITTDVTRSFREVGGALCEVNVLPAHRLLVEDPSTEAVVVALTAEHLLTDGAGVTRADVVAFVDPEPPTPQVRDVLARTGAEIVLARDPAVVAQRLIRSCPPRDAPADT